MPPDPRKFLSDILDRATFVSEFMVDKSLDDLVHNRPIRSAIERELMVLGEALYQLHRNSPEIAEQIDSWQQIIGFRHVLVHGYDSLNMRVIWDVIKDDLEPLIRQVNALLTGGAK
jgi:uncharacterized protein with HEPN domain